MRPFEIRDEAVAAVTQGAGEPRERGGEQHGLGVEQRIPTSRRSAREMPSAARASRLSATDSRSGSRYAPAITGSSMNIGIAPERSKLATSPAMIAMAPTAIAATSRLVGWVWARHAARVSSPQAIAPLKAAVWSLWLMPGTTASTRSPRALAIADHIVIRRQRAPSRRRIASGVSEPGGVEFSGTVAERSNTAVSGAERPPLWCRPLAPRLDPYEIAGAGCVAGRPGRTWMRWPTSSLSRAASPRVTWAWSGC